MQKIVRKKVKIQYMQNFQWLAMQRGVVYFRVATFSKSCLNYGVTLLKKNLR